MKNRTATRLGAAQFATQNLLADNQGGVHNASNHNHESLPMKCLNLAISALFLATSAQAHEFHVTFVVPDGAIPSVTKAFLLASSERDGHENETSEGHLGGVDSQLEVVIVGASVPASDIVVSLGPDSTIGIEPENAWHLRVATVSDRAQQAFFTGDRGGPFKDRYSARYGRPPDEFARLAYSAARLIDLAVRQQDGVDDLAGLSRAVAGY